MWQDTNISEGHAALKTEATQSSKMSVSYNILHGVTTQKTMT